MVIIRLIGGLGNQMFQYALAKKLSLIHSYPVKLDITGFKKYTLHKYCLGHLSITLPIASSLEVYSLMGLNKYFKKIRPFVIKERSDLYYSGIVNVPNDVYLDGHWQSEKYFIDQEKIIRGDFRIKTKPNKYTMRLMSEVSSQTAISLHVRRADYVTDSATNKILGTCSEEYYQRAINYLTKKIRKFHIFVFSDDINWAKGNLKFNQPAIFVDGNTAENNYDDLRLMSQCQHHIIANSTFSWWGAWLNACPQKIVIAPKGWFKEDSKNDRDIIPASWVRI